MKIREVKKYLKTAGIICFMDLFTLLLANTDSYEVASLFTTLTFFWSTQDKAKESIKQHYRYFNLDPQRLNQLLQEHEKIKNIPGNIIDGTAQVFDDIFDSISSTISQKMGC
jgi:hypothetical protein